MDQKQCTKCEIVQSLEEDFGIDRKSPDGRKRWCKNCCKAHQQRYKLENREKINKAYRDWYAKNGNGERVQASHRQSNEKHHEEIIQRDRDRWEKRRDEVNAKKRAKRAANPQPNREMQREWRRNNPESVKKSIEKHKEKTKERRKADPEFESRLLLLRSFRRRRYYERIRAETLAGYGGKCFCCGESNPGFLTLDHVESDGAQHRREVGSPSLYRWAIKNNFPDVLRLACYNCNAGRQFHSDNGVCPHRKVKQDPVVSSEALLYI